jgi:putative transposase
VTDVTNGQKPGELSVADERLVRELTERAQAQGVQLTGEGGLLGWLTKMVVEDALEDEMEDHLGYAKHDPASRTAAIPATGTGARRC